MYLYFNTSILSVHRRLLHRAVFKLIIMAQNKPKRVRAPDYTDEEINVIRSSFIKHNATLSAKHSNDTTQRVKDKIYQSIRLEVNAVGVTERSLQSIKDKWQALKKTVKEKQCTRAEKRRWKNWRRGKSYTR